jgi:hypothetical protein
MGRFVEGADRSQTTLLPECLDDFIAEDNPVRIIDAFVEELELPALGFDGATPATTGRPSYHPAVLLRIYIYGYLNRVQSSRRLERECQRNIGARTSAIVCIADRRRAERPGIAPSRRQSHASGRTVAHESSGLIVSERKGTGLTFKKHFGISASGFWRSAQRLEQ